MNRGQARITASCASSAVSPIASDQPGGHERFELRGHRARPEGAVGPGERRQRRPGVAADQRAFGGARDRAGHPAGGPIGLERQHVALPPVPHHPQRVGQQGQVAVVVGEDLLGQALGEGHPVGQGGLLDGGAEVVQRKRRDEQRPGKGRDQLGEGGGVAGEVGLQHQHHARPGGGERADEGLPGGEIATGREDLLEPVDHDQAGIAELVEVAGRGGQPVVVHRGAERGQQSADRIGSRPHPQPALQPDVDERGLPRPGRARDDEEPLAPGTPSQVGKEIVTAEERGGVLCLERRQPRIGRPAAHLTSMAGNPKK